MTYRRKSPFVVYEKISPNKNVPRNKPISRLTPHCVAGNLSMESTLYLPAFQAGGSASVNYSIGSDGRCGLGVEEGNRAWTSSSGANDHKAITFEISNDGGAPDWHMTDAAINAFLDLAVDICVYYGYLKVKYVEKPSHIFGTDAVEKWLETWVKEDEMIISLHNWYANKACPGSYFMSHIPWLVNEMNSRLSDPFRTPMLFSSKVKPEPPVDFNPYTIKITTDVLNIRSGPGINYKVVGSLSKNAPSYIHTIIEEQDGIGATKWGKLSSGLGWISLDYTTKVIFEPYQIKITTSALNVRSGPGTNYSIVSTLYNNNLAYSIVEERTGTGANNWGKLSSGLGWIALDYTTKDIFKPYQVKITTTALNIRSGPGTSYKIVKTLYNDKNIYTIVDEQKGTGATKWGKLSDGLWISLDYISKVS